MLVLIRNVYLKAILLTMLASAIIHMAITFGRFIVSGNYQLFNYFYLMDIYSALPWLPHGVAGFVWSQVFCLTLYGAVLSAFFYRRRKNTVPPATVTPGERTPTRRDT